MKILYVGMKYDYGDPKRGGYSLEHYNFYDSLVAMEGGAHEIVYFAFDEVMNAQGKNAMNRELLRVVRQEKPNFCFFVLFNNEIYKETLQEIKEHSGAVTYNWFCDDHWRFHNFSKHYTPYFHWVSTTDSAAPEKYHRAGFHHVLKTQWACSDSLYKPYPLSQQYDVLFIGQPYGERTHIINSIKDAGMRVDCFGYGWPNGRVWGEGMIQKFSEGKINLNFARSSGTLSLKKFGKIFFSKAGGAYTLNPISTWMDEYRAFCDAIATRQIKTRNFEVPGCGGFLMTDYADNLKDYYEDGKEIVVFKDVPDLIEKARYYLTHESERARIARAGYER
ncbi:MAG: glycosyltransferase, partial [Patescibacteria group bacterium]|nr:glycosyltransferase [Patescibacteria group bacterium]